MREKIIVFAMFLLAGIYKVDAQLILEPKHTINVEVGLPVTIGNAAFKRMMQGVVNTSMYYQYRMPSNLAFGAGINYSLFSVNVVKVNPSVKGSIYNYGGFFKIAHEKFHSESFGTDYGLKIGYNRTNFQGGLLDKTIGKSLVSVDTWYVMPMVSFKLMADEANAFNFTFGYTICNYYFSPDRLGFASQNLTPEQMKGNTQSMTVGFGYTHYIGQVTD